MIAWTCILAVMIANIAHGAAMRYEPSFDLGAMGGWEELGYKTKR